MNLEILTWKLVIKSGISWFTRQKSGFLSLESLEFVTIDNVRKKTEEVKNRKKKQKQNKTKQKTKQQNKTTKQNKTKQNTEFHAVKR